ncbi:uncharacterized protein LOC134311339 isoform X1 [Trichomycterus rosablanca]|uniref:uncharacterized protein LOC134311339 isoform X1 n=1 Tax=Trichomycterus rosablanca TaxID=2290929 RepID=UPI002F350513
MEPYDDPSNADTSLASATRMIMKDHSFSKRHGSSDIISLTDISDECSFDLSDIPSISGGSSLNSITGACGLQYETEVDVVDEVLLEYQASSSSICTFASDSTMSGEYYINYPEEHQNPRATIDGEEELKSFMVAPVDKADQPSSLNPEALADGEKEPRSSMVAPADKADQPSSSKLKKRVSGFFRRAWQAMKRPFIPAKRSQKVFPIELLYRAGFL